LRKGDKYSSFDKHRQFLPLDHAFRQDIKNFTKGAVITDPAPQMMTGAAVRAQVDAFEVNQEAGGFIGYSEQHAWTHKSGNLGTCFAECIGHSTQQSRHLCRVSA
jgi:hypothetical protein